MKSRHVIFPSLMIIFGALSLYFISQFAEPRFQDASVDAKFFPSVVAIAIILLSGVLVIQHVVQKQLAKEELPIFTKLSLFGLAFLGGYALLIHVVGYLIASFIAFTIYLIVFKVKKPLYYAVAWAFVYGIYYLFGEVFIIALPEGLLY